VPAGSVFPGTLTGALNVTFVSRESTTCPCAAATADVSSSAAQVVANAEVIRLICEFLLSSTVVRRFVVHDAYRSGYS
jgi:hypothetical protein